MQGEDWRKLAQETKEAMQQEREQRLRAAERPANERQ
jgi:hypothetical protein